MAKLQFTHLLCFLLVFRCCAVQHLGESQPAYKNPKESLGRRIKDILKRMTLAEKIGQMTQIERSVATPEVISQFFIGSVLSGGGSVPKYQASPRDWVDMINQMQKGAMSTRLQIPTIYGIDAVHGHNNAYKATIFPHNIGLGATWDPQLVKRIGAATAVEVRATGIQYVFAPCVAVCRDPRWGRCYESYSEDPSLVKAMTEIIPGLQGDIPAYSRKGIPFVDNQNQKVAACAKHYVGDGGTNHGVNAANTVIDFHNLLRIHMAPYYDSVKKGVSTVMVSYSIWNGQKMHANRALVTDYLKNTLKFRGFVISDMQGIDFLTSPPDSNYTYSVYAGINAGIDMVMVPFRYKEFIGNLTHLVHTNSIPISRIDDAVQRILRVKFTMGLFENPYGNYTLSGELGIKEHRELAREAVRKSLVLLRNGIGEEPVIPLDKNASKILVAGSHADNLGYQCGGWTIAWQGVTGNNAIEGTTILSAIKSTVSSQTEVVHEANPDAEFMRKNSFFSYAVVVVGEVPYAEGRGDSSNLTITEPGLSTIQTVCSLVKCLVIIISGRPVVIEPYLSNIDALVAAWLPGTEGQGIADVIFGDFGFTGKLPRTWFRNVDQLPMNVGDQNYDPLFPFGFGITT